MGGGVGVLWGGRRDCVGDTEIIWWEEKYCVGEMFLWRGGDMKRQR